MNKIKRAAKGTSVYNEVTGTTSAPGAFVADTYLNAEGTVIDELRYETPDQIRDREFAEDAVAEAVLVAEEAAARKAERIAVRTIISRRAAAGETPTRDELRLIADTSIEEAGPHARFADAALLARALIEQNPDAAYIAFEDEVELVGHGLAESHIRKAVILNASFLRIGEIAQSPDADYLLDDDWIAAKAGGSVTADDEIDNRISRVFPAIRGIVPTRAANGTVYDKQTVELKITTEARSFDDGTHPDVPNLFTVATAAAWVPGPLPAALVVAVAAPKATLLERFFGRDTARAMRDADRRTRTGV